MSVSSDLTDQEIVQNYLKKVVGSFKYTSDWEEERQQYFDQVDYTVIYWSVETYEVKEL